jgi:hypothetical protein
MMNRSFRRGGNLGGWADALQPVLPPPASLVAFWDWEAIEIWGSFSLYPFYRIASQFPADPPSEPVGTIDRHCQHHMSTLSSENGTHTRISRKKRRWYTSMSLSLSRSLNVSRRCRVVAGAIMHAYAMMISVSDICSPQQRNTQTQVDPMLASYWHGIGSGPLS